MLQKILITFLLFMYAFSIQAQQITSQLIDLETREPVPFASILFATNSGVMSNEEGYFDLMIPEIASSKDSISITSLGYKTKKFCVKDSIPKQIVLETEIFEIDPVVLTNKKLSVDEIIHKIKENLPKNYTGFYTKSKVFIRENYRQIFKKFNFDLEKSSIDNIDQILFDTITSKFPRSFTSLVESYGDLYIKDYFKIKLGLQKNLLMQSKHEQTSIKQIQDDFFTTLQKNTKPNSYLVIKSGFFRLDKTESIDSIMNTQNKFKERSVQKKNERVRTYRTTLITNMLKNLFINPDSSIDFINKSNRYSFEKMGYIEIEGQLAYIIEFYPKGSAKYKGRLYVNFDDYGIIRADIQGANKIFDKHFNMFGITYNDLSFSNTTIFTKTPDDKYILKYIKLTETQESGIDRPIKIIEKNKFVKGRRKQNQVSFQMNIKTFFTTSKELLISNQDVASKSVYDGFKPPKAFSVKRLYSYDVNFWKGQNIITPEKAVKDLVIE